MCSALLRLDVEVALIEHDWAVSVLNADVLVGDVVDATVANVFASPGLQTGAVLVGLVCNRSKGVR